MCLALALDPIDANTVYAGFGGFRSSAESGNIWQGIIDRSGSNPTVTWTDISQGRIKAPIHAITIHPQNNQWIYLGTELGIFASEDGGANWTAVSEGPANVAVMDFFWMGTTLVAVTHGRGFFQIDLNIKTLDRFLVSDIRGSIHAIEETGTVSSVVINAGSALSATKVMDQIQGFSDILGASTVEPLQNKAFVGDSAGQIFSIDTKTLDKKLLVTVPGAIEAVPDIYFHEDTSKLWLIFASSNGRIYSIDLISALNSGSPVMALTLGVGIGGNKIYTLETMDHWAYVATDQGVNAYNLIDATQNNNPIWRRDDLGVTDPILLANNNLYVASDAGLHCLEARTGVDIWTATTSTSVITKPAWAMGAVIVGTNGGELKGYNFKNGGELFSMSLGGQPVSGVAADQHLVFACTQAINGKIKGLKITSAPVTGAWTITEQWTADVRMGSKVAPIIVGESVYVADASNELTGFKITDGTKTWTNGSRYITTTNWRPAVVWNEAPIAGGQQPATQAPIAAAALPESIQELAAELPNGLGNEVLTDIVGSGLGQNGEPGTIGASNGNGIPEELAALPRGIAFRVLQADRTADLLKERIVKIQEYAHLLGIGPGEEDPRIASAVRSLTPLASEYSRKVNFILKAVGYDDDALETLKFIRATFRTPEDFEALIDHGESLLQRALMLNTDEALGENEAIGTESLPGNVNSNGTVAMVADLPLTTAPVQPGAQGSGGTAANTSRKRVSCVVTIDRSGSMSTVENGQTYLAAAIYDAGSFVYLMQNNDQLGVVDFDDHVDIAYPKGGSTVQTLTINSSVDDRTTATDSFFSLTPGGRTAIGDALSSGKSLLAGAVSDHNKAIVLLSDGISNEGQDPNSGTFLAGIKNAGIKVFTIGLGPQSDTNTLTKIATKTGGRISLCI